MKIEPRDQNVSPYDFAAAGYRDPSQATPSPQPPQALSPQIFQLPFNNNNSSSTILQNQLQGRNQLPPMQNSFQHLQQTTQVYTPNILSTSTFGNQATTWTNNGDPLFNQGFNAHTQITSPIFSDFVTPPTNVTQSFDVSMLPTSSNLMDLDLSNLSGELKHLSVSDLLK